MTSTTQSLKTSFESADIDKDNKLNEAELKSALVSLQINLKPEAIDSFFKQAPLEQPQHLNFSEFELFVHFYQSPFSSIDDVLIGLLHAVTTINHSFKTGSIFHSADSEIKIRIADSQASQTQFNSQFAFLAGDLVSNPHLSQFITKTVDSPLALVLPFQVNNGEAIVASINENLSAFKEVLAEISGEAKQVLANIEFKAHATPNGIQIIIDLSKIPILNTFTKLIQQSLDNLASHPSPLFLQLATTGDLSNLDAPFIHLTKEVTLIELELKTFALSEILKNENIKKEFKKLIEDKSPLAPLSALLLAIKKFDFEIELDHKVKQDALQLLGTTGPSHSGSSTISHVQKIIESVGGYDFLEMFDNGREVVRILKNNGTSNGGLFLKVHQVYIGFDFKANISEVITQILKLE